MAELLIVKHLSIMTSVPDSRCCHYIMKVIFHQNGLKFINQIEYHTKDINIWILFYLWGTLEVSMVKSFTKFWKKNKFWKQNCSKIKSITVNVVLIEHAPGIYTISLYFKLQSIWIKKSYGFQSAKKSPFSQRVRMENVWILYLWEGREKRMRICLTQRKTGGSRKE